MQNLIDISDFLDHGALHSKASRLGNCLSGTVKCITVTPQGSILAPFVFTLYRADFIYNTLSCLFATLSDNRALAVFVWSGPEGKYIGTLSRHSVMGATRVTIGTPSKTREMVVNTKRAKPPVSQFAYSRRRSGAISGQHSRRVTNILLPS